MNCQQFEIQRLKKKYPHNFPMLCDSEEFNFQVIGDYKVIRMIGSGSFSKVYEGISIETGDRVALKIIQKEKVKFDAFDVFENELDSLMRMSRHENVLTLTDAFETDSQLVIVTELCECGDLFSLLKKRGTLSESVCKHLFKGLLMGLLHIHEKHGICHRDLKLENILLSKGGNVVIADFGLSKVYNSVLLTRCGSEEYAAPEVILGEPYKAEKVDVWSFGVILFACLKGRLPFLRSGEIRVNSCNPMSLYGQILSKFVVIEGVSEECKQVLRMALERDPNKRATLKQLELLPFFS